MVAKRVPSDAAAVISNISLTSGKATPVEFVVTVALAEVGAEGPTRKVSIR